MLIFNMHIYHTINIQCDNQPPQFYILTPIIYLNYIFIFIFLYKDPLAFLYLQNTLKTFIFLQFSSYFYIT
jgi:hypothetical protein